MLVLQTPCLKGNDKCIGMPNYAVPTALKNIVQSQITILIRNKMYIHIMYLIVGICIYCVYVIDLVSQTVRLIF